MMDTSVASAGLFDVMAANVQAIEFDHPFTITVHAETVWQLTHPDGVYAPSVFHDEETDVRIDDQAGWEALTGFTGQDRYNGAVNHSSEFVGRSIARELVRLAEDEPQTYVLCVVNVEASDDEVKEKARELGLDYTTDAGWDAARDAADEEQEAAGWTILRKVEL